MRPEPTEPNEPMLRVLALIYPIERHVGHWACSSRRIEVERLVMDGPDLEDRLCEAARRIQPDAVAIIGKRVSEYHDLLDAASRRCAELRGVPRIYRCQNTVLAARASRLGPEPDRAALAALDAWFARACDRRFSLVLVQTLDDVELIGRALSPVAVAACPFGYDPAVFDPEAPELPRPTDVGCYLNLRDDARRARLVEVAGQICARRGWSFRFVSGRYWHDYAQQIRTTKICLHLSDQGEVPYRMYETTALGALFLSDPLRCRVETLFERGEEYMTFQPDLSDLEEVLASVLLDPARWDRVRAAGRARARSYTWPEIADRYVAPALARLTGRPLGGVEAAS
jgi:hypothetical protein